MRVFSEIQRFDQWWFYLLKFLLLGFLGYACYKWFILKENVGNVTADNLSGQLLLITTVFLVNLLFLLLKLETLMDERGISYRFYPFQLTTKLISWDTMHKCNTRRYKPIMEYGGWGFRIGLGGKALNVKGNRGVQIELKNGKRLLIGTQKPNEAQQVIQKHFNP